MTKAARDYLFEFFGHEERIASNPSACLRFLQLLKGECTTPPPTAPEAHPSSTESTRG